jgi:hypothetical protein
MITLHDLDSSTPFLSQLNTFPRPDGQLDSVIEAWQQPRPIPLS